MRKKLIGTLTLQQLFDQSQNLIKQLQYSYKHYIEEDGEYFVTIVDLRTKTLFLNSGEKVLLYWYHSEEYFELGYIKLDKEIDLENHLNIEETFRYYITKELRGNNKQIVLDSVTNFDTITVYWKLLILYFNDNSQMTLSFQNQQQLDQWAGLIQQYQKSNYKESNEKDEDFDLIDEIPPLETQSFNKSLNNSTSKITQKKYRPLIQAKVQKAALKKENTIILKQLEKLSKQKQKLQQINNKQQNYITQLQKYTDELKKQIAKIEGQQSSEDQALISTLRKSIEEEKNNLSKLKEEKDSILERLRLMEEVEQQNRSLRQKEKELADLKKYISRNQQIASEKFLKLTIQQCPFESIAPQPKIDAATEANQENEPQQDLLMQLRQERYLHIFQGNILHSCLEEKQFLEHEIQQYLSKQVRMTKLIYKYDKLNKTNFHSYIDGHPNVCLVVKLKNNRLIAAYTRSPIVQGTPMTEGGLIISLNERKTFPLIQGKRAVTFDTFFLIFGNSELRLKNGQMTLFTNFGIGNSHFNSKGEKYTVLTGEGTNKEEQIEDYEVFEVILVQ